MRFFFYGTLIAGSGTASPPGLHEVLRPLGPAAVRGRLFVVRDPKGCYPALLRGTRRVIGRLYQATADFGAEHLAAIDAYEGADYRRACVRTMPDDLAAEAYIWRGEPPAAAEAVPHGSFARFLAESGLPSYDPGR